MISLIVCFFLLSASHCYGAPGRQRSSRIYGGSPAAEGEFPFMVYTYLYENFLCTGTIINENWVLTSGQCADGYVLEAMTVHAGSTTNGPETGVSVGVIDRVVYPNFDTWGYSDDVALLKLAEPLTFSSTIQAVSLPSSGQQTAAGTTATAVGWESTGSAVTDLYKVDIPVWSDEDCAATYEYYDFGLRENNICAGAEGKGKCWGDAGGPLLLNGQQIGIASWNGYDCATADSPGVFAEVSYYVDWINQNAV